MPRWKMFFPVFIVTFALGTFGSPRKHHDVKKADTSDLKVNRKDPAFVAGYDEGYRQGANDSHGLPTTAIRVVRFTNRRQTGTPHCMVTSRFTSSGFGSATSMAIRRDGT
jgi:hypothetical protein